MAALTRSQIIAKFDKYLLQGSVDDLWDFEEKNDAFHNALDIISDEIINNNLPYYQEFDLELTLGTDGRYALPSRCRTVMNLWDNDGNAIHQLNPKHRKQGNQHLPVEGFCLINHKVMLLNFNSNPAVLYADVANFPTYIGDWDGTADLDEDAFKPEPPLDSERGARLIAKVMRVLAQVKDESVSEAQQAEITSLVTVFASRLGGMVKTGLKIIGT